VVGNKVLFLGPADSPLVTWLRARGEVVVALAERIERQDALRSGADFLVSYGYRHILGPDVLAVFENRAINLHISLLPWNRGADPNLWSFVENTPKGVTIHYLSKVVDGGDIIAQQELEFDTDRGTLATSYAQLQAAIQALFYREWPAIRSGRCARRPQIGTGSVHKLSARRAIWDDLPLGWDTPLSYFRPIGPE